MKKVLLITALVSGCVTTVVASEAGLADAVARDGQDAVTLITPVATAAAGKDDAAAALEALNLGARVVADTDAQEEDANKDANDAAEDDDCSLQELASAAAADDDAQESAGPDSGLGDSAVDALPANPETEL